MASKILCSCGELIRINLYEGNNLQLLVPEDLTDVPAFESPQEFNSFLDNILNASSVVVICSKCGVMSIIGQELSIKRYVPAST
ncbi:hypothetical protein EV696_12838 [Permianibacter aggregans]|uniref:Uncharacterized protein n=1 Tax=Permianibacter aggregans TaxID=1510150 RepID=A0A4R6UAK1_9GAMM|nr:hypothetical protein EV696_12838 [Permianibacter aggregans]